MNAQQLYRILFDRSSLTPEEENQITEQFQEEYKMWILRGLLKVTGAAAGLPYSETPNKFDYSPAEINWNWQREFENINELYNYFEGTPEETDIFKQIYYVVLLDTISRHPYDENSLSSLNHIKILSYKLMVYFGATDTRVMVREIDECREQCYTVADKQGISSFEIRYAFPLQLRANNKKNGMTAWRNILSSGNKLDAIGLFHITKEIEGVLGRAPANYEEANLTARTLVKNCRLTANQLYEIFLGTMLLPELRQHFIDSINDDNLKRFISGVRDLIEILPNLDAPCQKALIKRLGKAYLESITQHKDLYLQCLKKLSPQSIIYFIEIYPKQEIFSGLTLASPDYLKHFLSDYIPKEIRLDFFLKIIGKEKTMSMINFAYNLEWILDYLPAQDRLSFVKEFVDRDKLKEFSKDKKTWKDIKEKFVSSADKEALSQQKYSRDELTARTAEKTAAIAILRHIESKIQSTNWSLGLFDAWKDAELQDVEQGKILVKVPTCVEKQVKVLGEWRNQQKSPVKAVKEIREIGRQEAQAIKTERAASIYSSISHFIWTKSPTEQYLDNFADEEVFQEFLNKK